MKIIAAWPILIIIVLLGCSEKKESATQTTPAQASPKPPSLGIWGIGNYADKFGDKTDEQYIANRALIRGKFSNVATTDSPLDVQLSFSERNGLIIQLWEYGKEMNSLASFIGYEKTEIAIQDGLGNNHSFQGLATQSFLYFDPADHEAVRQILESGGTVKFRITTDTVGVKSNYSFDITKADGFDVAYEQLIGSAEAQE
jgi:hypothetical protein